MKAKGLIEPWGVIGNGPIRLDIPRSVECVGMPEFFIHIFKKYDKIIGCKESRVAMTEENTQVKFYLEELAGAAFGSYAPRDFARTLEPKLTSETEVSKQLCNKIATFEDRNRTAYLVRSSVDYNCYFYHFHPGSNINEGQLLKILFETIPVRYRSQTKHKTPEWFIRRKKKDVKFIFPVKGSYQDIRFVRKRLMELPRPITLYIGSKLIDLDLDPLNLIRKFEEIDTSKLDLVSSLNIDPFKIIRDYPDLDIKGNKVKLKNP